MEHEENKDSTCAARQLLKSMPNYWEILLLADELGAETINVSFTRTNNSTRI